MKDLHKRIKDARIDAGLSQQQLAAAMGTSQTKVSILESGGRSPKMATLMAIAKACKMELNISFEPKAKGAAKAAAPKAAAPKAVAPKAVAPKAAKAAKPAAKVVAKPAAKAKKKSKKK
jgi:transcriptional regulator with XRE-family HTH domain